VVLILAVVKQRESGLPSAQRQSPQEDANLHGNASPVPQRSRCSVGFIHGLPGVGRSVGEAVASRAKDDTMVISLRYHQVTQGPQLGAGIMQVERGQRGLPDRATLPGHGGRSRVGGLWRAIEA